MNEKIEDYIILETKCGGGITLKRTFLCNQVLEYIKKGYIPSGGICVDSWNDYYQAMIKYTKE